MRSIDCGVGFAVSTGGPQQSSPGQTIGAESILDAVVTNTPIFLTTSTAARTFLSGSLLLENIKLSNVPKAVVDGAGTTLLAGSAGSTTIAQWVQGNTFTGSSSSVSYKQASLVPPTKPASLTADGAVFGRTRNQYEGYAPSRMCRIHFTSQ